MKNRPLAFLLITFLLVSCATKIPEIGKDIPGWNSNIKNGEYDFLTHSNIIYLYPWSENIKVAGNNGKIQYIRCEDPSIKVEGLKIGDSVGDLMDKGYSVFCELGVQFYIPLKKDWVAVIAGANEQFDDIRNLKVKWFVKKIMPNRKEVRMTYDEYLEFIND